MKAEEWAKIWFLLAKSYTWFKDDDAIQMEVWYKFFKHDNYEDVLLAAQAYISHGDKQPTIASLRDQLHELTDEAITITPDEAWGQIRYGIRVGLGSPYMSHVQMKSITAKMHPLVYELGTNMGWRELGMMDEKTFSVARGQFMRLWDAKVKNHKQKCMLPAAIKDKLFQSKLNMNLALKK